MRHGLLTGSALLALIAWSQASAQVLPPRGVYVAGDIGYHASEGIEAESNTNASDGRPYDWSFSAEDDVAGFLRLGYRFSPNFRAEIEGGHRPGDIESVRGAVGRAQPIGLCRAGIERTVASPVCQNPIGEITANSLMFNVLYDILPDSRFQPFVGAGVGLVEVHNKVYGQLSGVPAGAARFQNASFDDIDQGFGYQGILGLAYAITDRLTVDVTGRYLAANELEFGAITTNNTGGTAGGTITPIGIFEGDYRDTSISLGLRYQFGAFPAPPEVPLPPPPAPPLPPPPPPPPVGTAVEFSPRAFVVYFPFDQYVLTTEAQQVIQDAASYAQSGGATSVAVVGHADTSGSQNYNVRLSERRSKAVADALVGLGVSQAAMSVDWRGEAEPAVSTGDGVKEPLNRRSTININ